MSKFNSNVFNYINRNQIYRQPKSNIKDQGSIIKILLASGKKEPAITLVYVTKQQVRKYMKDNRINYDFSNNQYSTNYTVAAHFKLTDVKSTVESFEKTGKQEAPDYNLLVLQVSSKTDYHIVTQLDEPIVTMIMKIVNELPNLKELLNELFRIDVMQLATDDMKRAYEEGNNSLSF